MPARALIDSSSSDRRPGPSGLSVVPQPGSVEHYLQRQRQRVIDNCVVTLNDCSLEALEDRLHELAGALGAVHLYEHSLRLRELAVMLRHPSCTHGVRPTIRARALAVVSDAPQLG